MAIFNYQFPSFYQSKIDNILKSIGYNLTQPESLAREIKKLSDHFIQENQKVTPWQNTWAQAAYISYFFPLNYLRMLKVIKMGSVKNIINNEDTVIDFGSGCGTASLALADSQIYFKKIIQVETSNIAINFYDLLISNTNNKVIQKNHLESDFNFKDCTLLLSYSLNEINSFSEKWLEAKNIIIVEPSTKYQSKKLIELRSYLIENGFYALAPCTHQDKCPLTDSKHDWCHDRAHIEIPEWLKKIEKYLPIRNETLTFSYLIMTKTVVNKNQNSFRLVGDELTEKGKTRWLACHNKDRLFVSWLNKWKNTPQWKRGDLVEIENFEIKGNEIRPLND